MSRAKDDRILQVARPRVILGAAATAWTAAEVMHAAGVSAVDPALATLALSGLTYGSRFRQGTRIVLASGAWVTAATYTGPLGSWHLGPVPVMTLTWGAGALAGLIAATRHEAVVAAKRWREARFAWLHEARRYGLGGSHLLEHEDTRLGERQVLDVTGTGKLASQIASAQLAERIAQHEGLPVSRVKVRAGAIAGRVEISRRYRDPWKYPILHPVLDPEPEITLPVPGTVCEPLIVGQDPETGDPLTVIVWDSEGAKNILIVGKKRAGKTVLLSDLRERITAAADTRLWNINVSKSVEDRRWAPACYLSALGPDERKKAVMILRLARRIIDARGAAPRATKIFQPTAGSPLIVIIIDEIDALVAGGDRLAQMARADLAYIASKNGSEGVTLIIAGQRGTADWMGGSNIRTQVDYVAVGKVGRRGEMMHAAGEMGLLLPDMATYGEGHAGVWVIAEAGGDHEIGRTFKLDELHDIDTIAQDRPATAEPLEAELAPALAGAYAEIAGAPPQHASADAPVDMPAPPGAARPPAVRRHEAETLSTLEEDLDVPDELRDQLTALDAKLAAGRSIREEIDRTIESLPDVPADRLAESVRRRWHQVAEQADIPPEAREHLLALLAGEEWPGMRKVADRLGTTLWTLRTWLEVLRQAGLAEVTGKKGGRRWQLVAREDGDAQ